MLRDRFTGEVCRSPSYGQRNPLTSRPCRLALAVAVASWLVYDRSKPSFRIARERHRHLVAACSGIMPGKSDRSMLSFKMR